MGENHRPNKMGSRWLHCERYYCTQTRRLLAIPPSRLIDSSRTLVDIVSAFDSAALSVHPSVDEKRYLIFA